MYRDSYQRGNLTVFYSCGAKPLAIWETRTQDGYISRFLDQDIKSMVLDICGTNISTTYMTCPKGKQVLGIHMPFLVMIVKNLKKYFSFEVTILDETNTRRRFRVSNFQSTTQVLPLCTVMPIGLADGWNQIQFNLAEFTRRAYKKQFVEVQKLKINANIRLRRIYFAERLMSEDQLPPEYRLYFPLGAKGGKTKKATEEPQKTVQPSTSHHEAVIAALVEKPPSVMVLQPSSKTSIHSVKKSVSQTRQSATQVRQSKEVIVDVKEEEMARASVIAEEGDETPVPAEGDRVEDREGAPDEAHADQSEDTPVDTPGDETQVQEPREAPTETTTPAEAQAQDTPGDGNDNTAEPSSEEPPPEQTATPTE